MTTLLSPEARLLEAQAVLAKHSTVKAAAAELGVTSDALTNLFRRSGDKSASYYLGRVTVPEGHRVRGNSTLQDADGNIDRRWIKTERDSGDPPKYPIPAGHEVGSTLVDGQGEIRAQWLKPKPNAVDPELFWKAAEKHLESYRGIAGMMIPPEQTDDRLLALYPLGDPHIGMLAWGRETGGQDFDVRIAERDLYRVVDMVADRMPGARRAVLANVGDFFHAENDSQLTPASKNKLDCDDRWLKVTEIGFSLMRRMIDRLLQKHAELDVFNVPGNHDPQMARMLALFLRSVYEDEPRVQIADNASPYAYLQFGKNLLGFAHGDKAKLEALPAIMATDRPAMWGTTTHRLWVTGHVHHLVRKEFPGCVCESFRTLAPRDAWHNEQGYRSGQSMTAIALHEDYGEDMRVTVPLCRARVSA